MQSVAHNGFGCPYCRTAMAEEPEEESAWSDEQEMTVEQEMFNDNALRGFRFFWNLLNEEEHDEDDDADEQQLEEWAERVANEEVDPNIPSTTFVAQKLREQGVTFEQIIDMICKLDHNEYQTLANESAAEEFDNVLFGKIRIIVSNYTPQQAVVPEPVAPAPVTPAPAPEVDFAAQPKTTQVRSFPRFNIHV
jgi:hypothetical protein